MITIRDVAKHAGVSISTVSRVINNYGYVTKEKRELVKKAISELGYVKKTVEIAEKDYECSRQILFLNKDIRLAGFRWISLRTLYLRFKFCLRICRF